MVKPSTIIEDGKLKYLDTSGPDSRYTELKFDISEDYMSSMTKIAMYIYYVTDDVYLSKYKTTYMGITKTEENKDVNYRNLYTLTKMRQVAYKLYKLNENKINEKDKKIVFGQTFEALAILGLDSESIKYIVENKGYKEFEAKYMSNSIVQNGRVIRD